MHGEQSHCEGLGRELRGGSELHPICSNLCELKVRDEWRGVRGKVRAYIMAASFEIFQGSHGELRSAGLVLVVCR